MVLLTACSGPARTPQARIRALIAHAEKAAEARDISVFKDMASRHYRDRYGNDRRAILQVIEGMFLRNRAIHLLSVVKEVKVEGSRARAQVFVAMAGHPIESAESLFNLHARLMRFDVEFDLEGGDWRVRSVAWRPAKVGDFL